MNIGEDMAELNDHDLLIALNTRMDMVIKFMSDYNSQMIGVVSRISALENKDSRDSEKVQSISKDVQTSLRNSESIIALQTEMTAMREDIADLKTKSNMWSILNSIGVAVVGILTVIFK